MGTYDIDASKFFADELAPICRTEIQAAVAKVEDNLDRLTELLLKWDAGITEEVAKD